MSELYASRNTSINSDGTPVFATRKDFENQKQTACIIEKKFGPNLELREFGRLCPIDYYALRDGRTVAFIEIKSRSHHSFKFKTVFLNFRKWISLRMAEVGVGVPSFFFVKFKDKILYTPVSQIDASRLIVGGTSKIVKSKTDIEPVIEIDVSKMMELCPCP